MWLMVFRDSVKSTSPVMLAKSAPPTSRMKLSARRSSTVRRSMFGGTKRRPLSAQSVLRDSERFLQTQWNGHAETTPHVSPATAPGIWPKRAGSKQAQVNSASQCSNGSGSVSEDVSGGEYLLVNFGHSRGEDWRNASEGLRIFWFRWIGGWEGNEGECVFLWGWHKMWGGCGFLNGWRGGESCMVDRGVIHRPRKRRKRKTSVIVF